MFSFIKRIKNTLYIMPKENRLLKAQVKALELKVSELENSKSELRILYFSAQKEIELKDRMLKLKGSS